jgi:D-alanyl-D-alanine carboxypeptidase
LLPKPLETPESATDLAELEDFLGNLAGYNADSPAGLSLVVVKDGETVYQKGFGQADGPQDRPATPETVYQYWSMTKIITAVAILQLHEQGLLNIDDPVVDYLAFFEVEYPSADSETITIRHLLNHSSGLSNTGPEIVGWIHYDGDPGRNQTDLIREKLPEYAVLSYEPGSKSVYTNVGYMLLAAVIEAASGQTYEEYVVEHILEPLEMNQTGFTYTDSMVAAEATGAHPRVDLQTMLLPFVGVNTGSLVRERQDGILWFNHVYSDQNGPTGLIGSPTDLARFVLAYWMEANSTVSVYYPKSQSR